MSSPRTLFGCANIGKAYSTKAEVETLLETLKRGNVNHLDTAARYPPTSPGLSEKLLGEANAGDSMIVDTKILIHGDGSGTLKEEAIGQSIKQSYESLKLSKINVLYCHGPDKKTPIAEQAAAFDKYYREGKFKHLGVSNFSIEMLQEWLEVAENNNYIKPTYYQGQYNLICRSYEEGLFPFLRKHGIYFNAFGPLAGGFLTGKLTANTSPSELVGTRFEVSDSNPFGRAGRNWYDKPSMYRVIEKLGEIATSEKVPMEELAVRWLLYHSVLQKEDGVIFGASSPQQAEKTMQTIKRGPVSMEAAKQLSEVWEICKEDARGIVSY